MKRLVLFFSILFIAFISLISQQTPDDYLGVKVGGDRVLVAYPEIVSYFKYLDENSGRLTFRDEGKTTLGNSMWLALVSSEKNIRELPRLLEINRMLANPGDLSENDAKQMISGAPVFVLVTASLHATEIGASQMMLEWAHDLVTTKNQAMLDILDRVVILLMPSINPDGQIMVCDWYKKYLGTRYEGGRMPFLYHHYAGHDNNRDFFMLNLKESRIINAILHQKYFPQVFLDMHQMGSNGPRIFVPPFKDPLNRNLSPVMIREVELIGASMALKLQEKGKSGVANGYGFDAYWPGGSKNTAWYKNVVGLLTELASVRMATPVNVDRSELQGGGKGLPEYKAQVNFPDPWLGGKWTLRDILEYERIACDALVEVTAKYKGTFLENFYRMGVENIKKGEADTPFAYIVSPDQWDLPGTYTFLQKMMEGGVHIYRLEKDWECLGRIYGQGSFIIPMNQPYRSFVQAMMERQKYPEIRFIPGGPILEPYDMAGWTLPLMMNVRYESLLQPLDGAMCTSLKALPYPDTIISGEGDHYCIPARFNRSFIIANRLKKSGIPVWRVEKADHGEAGDFLVSVESISETQFTSLCKETGVPVSRIKKSASARLVPSPRSRIAVYQSYLSTADEGWTRWVLDEFEFPYTVIHNDDFKDKGFIQKYDTVIFASQNRSVIVDGKYFSTRPAPFLPKEYMGGIGKAGVEVLKKVVSNGGRLILLDRAFELAQKDFELPVRNVIPESGDVFECPGSILQVEVDLSDPLAWGMESRSVLFFSNSVAFNASNSEDQSCSRHITARFALEGPHLLSGYLKGGKKLDNAVASVWYEIGKGKVVLLGGRVQSRAQTFATFKFLFNAIGLN